MSAIAAAIAMVISSDCIGAEFAWRGCARNRERRICAEAALEVVRAQGEQKDDRDRNADEPQDDRPHDNYSVEPARP